MAELKPVQLQAAVLLSTGTSITEVAEKAAITRQTIHKWLKDDDEFTAYLNALKSENIKAARAAIQSAAVLAINTISSIMKKSQNDAVRLACAKEVLAMAGLTKDTASLANKGIGATTAEAVRAEKEKARKNKAQMAMWD
jgi:Transposase.